MVAADFDSIDAFIGQEWARRGVTKAWRDAVEKSDVPGDASTEPSLRLGFGIQSQSCQMYWMDQAEFDQCPKSAFQPLVSIYSSAPDSTEPVVSRSMVDPRHSEELFVKRIMLGADQADSQQLAYIERMIKDIAALSAFPGEFLDSPTPPAST